MSELIESVNRRNAGEGDALSRKKDSLRFVTCGSVDDGKSTLIGRLLFDSNLIPQDTLAQLESDSKQMGTQGPNLDLALLLDGLAAEREQGITIDVAYRYFETSRRSFIVADSPGHEQYTANMVTAASNAELALILVDATKGVLRQTRRHAKLVNLLGVRHIVLVVNKMDLVNYDSAQFEDIRHEFAKLIAKFENVVVEYVPVSALVGDNIVTRSERTPWYSGPTLIDFLETVDAAKADVDGPVRFPVQWVNRQSSDFRGYAGTVAQGVIAPGDRVVVQPSGVTTTVKKVISPDLSATQAIATQAATVVLEDEVDVSRGDVISSAQAPAQVADRFQASLVWFSEEEMLPGRSYQLKLGTKVVSATFESPRYVINVDTQERLAARTLHKNDIGTCHLSTASPIVFEPYTHSRELGGFIVIDRLSKRTVAAGMIDHELRRSDNIRWHQFEIDADARRELSQHGSGAIWFTGLSGSGKSTIANLVERALYTSGVHTYILDGDNVRRGLNKDLGFTDADRVENIRRVAEVANLMIDAGLVVLVSFISPFRSEREMARDLIGANRFIEVYVDTPLEVAESRDPKGLYKKARAGQIPHFTGIDSPYEAPLNPEVRVDTTLRSEEDSALYVLEVLQRKGLLRRNFS